MVNQEKPQNDISAVPAPPDFKDIEHGPLNNNQRQCRDFLCLVIFLANIVVLVVIAIWAYSTGHPYLAFRATDSSKNVCGMANTPTADFPYAYLYNPMSINNRICVKECPLYQNGNLKNVQCYNGTNGACTYTIKVKEDGTVDGSFLGTDFIGYGSFSILGRVCLPELKVLNNAFSSYSTTLSEKFKTSYLNHFITDIQNNWYWILLGFGFTIVIAFIIMFLMRWIAAILVWVSIITILFIFIAFGLIFLYQGGVIESNHIGSVLGTLGIPTSSRNEYYNVYGYISFGIAGLLFLAMLCCCSKIRLTVAVCKVSGQFLIRVAQVLLVPIIITALILCLWAFGLSAMVYIISTATFVANGDIFTSIDEYTSRSLGMFYYFFFGILWTNAYLGALSIFVVASCCCMWYFSRGPGDQLSSPVITSFWRSFRFHWGSLAFGALILAIVQMIQIVVEGLKRQGDVQNSSPAVKCMVGCLQCMLKCLERIIEYLNKQAYIQIALRGKNFCMASIDGLTAILSNPVRYSFVSGVGAIMMFITELLITSGGTVLFWVLITFKESIRNNMMEPIFMLVVVGLGSFMIAKVFMSVYSVSMDTILACFIADETNQKGKSGRALYAPPEMVELMDK